MGDEEKQSEPEGLLTQLITQGTPSPKHLLCARPGQKEERICSLDARAGSRGWAPAGRAQGVLEEQWTDITVF